MEFQVSARKWRPQKFEELVGQEHIIRTLCNAIRLDRVSHAYLFSGTRGVGKTTTARILAKALNCVDGPTTEPCDQCTHCVEIREGNSIDVMEIDGASNNSVAEARDLIDNVQYATSACRYKIYIIDEVHMLSKSAFNALLKTLEEPPAQVVFIFATTELLKIPETILSRCQCFEFKPLSLNKIIQQMQLICRQEGIAIDPLSLEQIAKSGAGSMRDAQSLLDQVIAFCGKEITPGSVESVLGIVGQTFLERFADHLIAKDADALLSQVQDITRQGKDVHLFCRDLIEYVRNLLFFKVAKNPETILNTGTCNLDTLKKQSEAFHADELHQMFAVLSRVETEMKRSSHPQMLFEMAVLRLNDIRPFQDIEKMIEKINQIEEAGLPSRSESQIPPMEEKKNDAHSPTLEETAVTDPVDNTQESAAWEKIKSEVCARKFYLHHFLGNCRLISMDPSKIQLDFPDPFSLQRIEKEENLQIIKEAVKTVCGFAEVEIKLTHGANGGPVQEMPPANNTENHDRKVYNESKENNEAQIIQDALDIFGGSVIH